MVTGGESAIRAAAYRDVEDLLDSNPDAIALRQQRACLMGLLGRRDEAHAAFIELLGVDPKNFGVLNDFGMFLFSGGLRGAATVALKEAVRWHPDDSVGRTNLGSLLLTGGEIDAARAEFERAVELDPSNPKAREGLSLALARLGDLEGARAQRPTVVRKASLIAPLSRSSPPVKVLLVESVIGGKTYAHDFLADPAFDVKQVFLEYLSEGIPLPEHDVIWNAIGDAERCANILDAAPAAFARSNARTLNRPELVRATTRVAISERLSRVNGVVAPKAKRFARAALRTDDGPALLTASGFTFPLLLRSPGFHTGEHFVRVERPEDVREAAAALPGKTLNAIEFVDVRSGDGKVRKYRVIAVAGRLYPLHLAVSERWKVHYFSADMSENEHHRAEDRRFLTDMSATIGSHAVRTLEAVAEALALDYGGVDFALDAQGRVVVFEANATMIVPEPEDGERWAYRRAPVQRIYDAVRTMLTA